LQNQSTIYPKSTILPHFTTIRNIFEEKKDEKNYFYDLNTNGSLTTFKKLEYFEIKK